VAGPADADLPAAGRDAAWGALPRIAVDADAERDSIKQPVDGADEAELSGAG
jgi:hypothetical protein